MKVKILEHSCTGIFGDLLYNAFLSAITGENDTDFTVSLRDEYNPDGIDIEFIVNGRPLNVEDFFERLDGYIKEDIEIRAKEMVEERFNDGLSEQFSDLHDIFYTAEENARKAFGISRNDNDQFI